MTKSSKTKLSKIDIDKVLKARRQVAVIWSIEDVQSVRSDLNDDQSWQVLEECHDMHDCETGFTWTIIEDGASDLFPPSDENDTTEEGDRP